MKNALLFNYIISVIKVYKRTDNRHFDKCKKIFWKETIKVESSCGERTWLVERTYLQGVCTSCSNRALQGPCVEGQ
jgi:hypothetical protein